MNILAALRSRWSIFLSCRDLSPRVISMRAFQMSLSLILVLALRCWLMTFMRSPPLANSMMMQRLPEELSQKASLNLMMQSSLREARILISLRAFSFSFYFMPEMRTFLSAQISLSWRRLTWQTCPKAPSPIFLIISKFLRFPYSLSIINQEGYTMGPYLASPNLEKATYKAENAKLKQRFARCEMQGWRRTMEDAAVSQLDIGNGNSLYAVFDGHGGHEVSKLVEKVFVTQLKATKQYKEQKYKEALIETFKRIDEFIESKDGEEELKFIRKKSDASSFNDNVISMGTGCTACVVLVTPTKIFTANAGDSRAVLSRKGHALPLSYDHKPENEIERKRISAAGGEILNGRVNGGLNLSRSLGDFNYKRMKNRPWDEQLISCKPDVSEINRQPGDDEFIILGCDGIWEKYVNDSQPMVTKIENLKKTGHDCVSILKTLLDELVARETSEEVGCDNMTCVLIEFL